MSEEPSAEAPVDFDRAEFTAEASSSPMCSACKRSLGKTYFTINASEVCEDCHHLVSTQLKDSKSFAAFGRALGLGGLAAIGGSIAWYAVAKITGMELGLLAIAVGWVVGKAVRRGSRSLGAKRYQALAMLLTYVSITGSYIPLVLKTLSESSHQAAAAAAASGSAAAAAAAPSAATAGSNASPSPSASAATAAGTGGAAGTEAPPPLGLQIIVTFVLVIGIALVAPFLGGASNIIGILLIGIALYEAWKFNRAVPIVIDGPLKTRKLRPDPPAPSAEG